MNIESKLLVSGNRVHFGCCGYQSPSSEISKQWEPQTAALPSLGLISVHAHIIAWTAIPFIPSIHHKITLVVSGKRQQLIKTVISLTAEGPLNGLRWIV